VAQKFHFAILRIEVTRASRGLSAIAELLVPSEPMGLLLAEISFLLPFLRVRYFSQLEARKLLDNFMTRRTKFAKWFRNLDPADPKILDVYDRG